MKAQQTNNKQNKNKINSDTSQFQAASQSGSKFSHQDSECVKRQKIQKLKKKKRRIYDSKSKGNWNKSQDTRFIIFMIQNRNSFEQKNLRRSKKIFKQMAKFVSTRSPEQCRSHHQKYEKKFITFDQIISSIQKKIDEDQEKEMKIQELKRRQLKYKGRVKKEEPYMYYPQDMYRSYSHKQFVKNYQKPQNPSRFGTEEPLKATKIVECQTHTIQVITCNGLLSINVVINLNDLISY